MILKRSVRIVKKIQIDRVWKFVSLERQGTRYVWDDRPGGYFLDWHEGGRRRREFAGHTPAQVLQAQRRKQAEIAGALVLNGHGNRTPPAESLAELADVEKPEVRTPIDTAIRQFLVYVAAHSPDKPETVRRYHPTSRTGRRHRYRPEADGPQRYRNDPQVPEPGGRTEAQGGQSSLDRSAAGGGRSQEAAWKGHDDRWFPCLPR